MITLGIIGVVAALTLPNLIQEHEKKVVPVELKKMYSTLLQAIDRYKSDYDVPVENYDTSLSAKKFMEKYFNPYLNIAQTCESTTECWEGGRAPTAIDGHTKIQIQYGVILADGAILAAYRANGGLVFFFDINGVKGVNKSGRDIFNYYIINSTTMTPYEGCDVYMRNLKSGLYPGGYAACFIPFTRYKRDTLTGSSIHRGCTKKAASIGNSQGDACAALIMIDGWVIKKDYPW